MEVQDLVKFAKECQGLLDLDTPSLIRVGGQLAVKVNSIQNLSGQEKQKLVCQILKTVVSEKLGDSEKAASLQQIVDDVVPASLDLALAAARGKLDLKKVKMSVWVKYFSCCAHSVVKLLVSKNVISQEQAKQVDSVLNTVEEKAAAAAATADAFEQKNPMHSADDDVAVAAPVVAVAPVVAAPAAVVVDETKSEVPIQESKSEESQKTE